MNDRWERLTDLYHAAVALPADERASLFAEECAYDPALQADVERMIAAHDRATELAEPAADAGASEPDSSNVAYAPAAVDRFAFYRVVKELGHGPAGTVYLAERDDEQSDQRVAIKLIEGEMDPGLALERLRMAHQTLGSRDHANIARLIEGATTEDGRPYAVMEYVPGEPIDTHADGHRLSIAERLQLFLQVCGAVSYAHRRRVMHGNLKSTNILVTSAGVPKLLDFGIVEPQDTPAADIYALGGVLDALLGGGSSNGERRRLRNDLDTIVLKALTKGGDRGYESVDQLAEDVRRYVATPPTRGRPDNANATTSASPRRGRFSGILTWMLAGAALAALGMEVAPLVTSRPYVVPAPLQAAVPATRERVLVSDLTDHIGDPQLVAALSDAFRAGLTESPSVQILSTRRQGVKTFVTGTIDSIGSGYAITAQLTRPAKRERPAELRETATDSVGVVRALSRLSARLREQLGETPSGIADTPRLDEVTTWSLPALRSYANGVRAVNNGDRAGGIRSLKAAIALDSGFAAAHRLLATTYGELGDRARAADALDHAIANQARLPFYERNQTIGSHAGITLQSYATAVDAYNRILTRNPDDLRALANLGSVYSARREYAVQESLLVRALAVDSGVPSLYTGLALAQVNQGKYDDARRVLDKAEQRFPGMRSNQLAAVSLASSKQDWETAERQARGRIVQAADDSLDALDGLETLAGIVMTQGRLAEAEQGFRRVIALGARDGSTKRALSSALRLSYVELRYRHSPSAAIATMNAALSRFPVAKIEEEARPYDEIARLFADAGQPARARELVAQAKGTRFGRQRGTDANRRWTLGAIAMAEGRAWEGEIEILRAAEAHPCPICALPDLARAYEVAGKPDSAIAMYERYVHAPWQRRFETDGIELGFAMRRLGELYQQQNDRTKAAAQYTALLQLWRGADTELDPLLADVRRRLEQTTAVAGAR